MLLYYNITDELRSIAEKTLESKIEYCVPYDLGFGDTKKCNAFLIIGKSRFALIDDGKVVYNRIISDMHDFVLTPQVGNVLLEASDSTGSRIICRVTMRHAARYAYIAQILEMKSKNKPEKIFNDEPENRCPKCGKVLTRGLSFCPSCMNRFSTAKRLFRIGRKQMGIVAISTLLAFVITAISVITPRIQHILTDQCLNTTDIIINPNLSTFTWCIIGMAFCLVLTKFIDLIRGRTVASMSPKISAHMRDIIYKQINGLSLRFLTSQRTGDIMNRITWDIDRISGFISDFFLQFIHHVLLLIVVSIILFMTDWRMALCVLLPAPIVAFGQMWIWRKILRRLYHHQFKLDDKTNSYLHDTLSGVRVVKAFGREKAETQRFDAHCSSFAKASIRSEQTWYMIIPIANLIASLTSMLVVYLGSTMILQGEFTVGGLTEFQSYAALISGPVSWIMGLPRRFADASISIERLYTVIEELPDIANNPEPIIRKIDGNVTINNVTFGYNSYEPVLKNINLEVKKGELIGLVGHSGAGKSTLINLICRFYDANDGAIMIDDICIKDYDMHSFHSQIGVVLQETFLFTGTIFDNIRYAKPDATVEEVIVAAKAANAHDFIVSFPDGYDTWVNENGNNFSGGERQRLAIARALLVDPRILILDEATSALDIDTESSIQEALNRLINGRTTFAIAHRLSTLKNADRLVVFDKGMIAEVGTHKELLEKKGIYYGLVMAQRQMTKTKYIAS